MHRDLKSGNVLIDSHALPISVQVHFRRLPARYALSVNPDDVPLHMRLLAQNLRDPTAIAVNAQLKKDDNGEIVPNRTADAALLDRFVAKGSFMSDERQVELRAHIEQNLQRLSMDGEDMRPSITCVQDSGGNENVSLAEKLGVLRMVDKNEIRAEWKLDLNELRLEKAVAVGEELLNEFHREAAVVTKLRHPNIVLFLGAAIINPPRYCLVFEFMEMAH
ncbi:unnamed protein product [Peronospora destructor]|uniref:Protein kinase domain-containing protein n=1 Tax=Peronospora destructor TaxID=86335 RepID=A0AAV0U3D6_9STRA|nr:unnamed protein product [Peronospora destructor]